MGSHFPFSFTVDLEPRAVHDNIPYDAKT
jgi:hypothetical protein